jgi:HK97 family phage major capsid protein
MALQTSGIVLPRTVALEITQKAKDSSTIAALSPAKPEIFADETYLVFNGASEAEVVAEGAQKSSYNQTVTPIVGTKFTVQTTTRVSNQLLWADEDNQLEIIDAIQNDQAGALGRALDYVVYHAVNPKTGTALGAGFTALSGTATKAYLGAASLEAATKSQLVGSVDEMIGAVNDLYEINGVALSKPYANALRKLRTDNGYERIYPEIPLNLNVQNIEGVPAATSGTVNGRALATPSNVLAFMGDFGCIRWGMVRDIKAEIIPYGDPDGAGDLKRLNQIAYRTEAVYAYAVTDPAALSVLLAAVKPA